ncbi:TPA: hypothetical protein MHZ76_29965 [Klebsiella pneumoniae subsp. pneumoniae]|nr:hypothetical protein [Klebsiella pneumoniae subsp. pneumoniae]
MMSLWDALRMNMMISYQELVRTFLRYFFCLFFSTLTTVFEFGSSVLQAKNSILNELNFVK